MITLLMKSQTPRTDKADSANSTSRTIPAARLLSLVLCVLLFAAPSARSQATATAPPASKAPAPAPEQAKPWTKIPIPQLPAFKPQEPRRIELANGLVIFLQEDHELPFIDGTILIRGGSRDVPAGKTGLIPLYGEAWRTSGSATTSGDALDTELAEKAASIETDGGGATTSLAWGSFKQDFDSVFAQALDLLMHPAFKADKLALAKRGMDTAISRRNDEPDSIASRVSNQLVYGKDSPYAREPEYATVDAVTLDDLKAWHNRTVIPNGMIVAVEGDFNSAEMEAKLRKAFESMPRGQAIPPLHVEVPGPVPGVYFAEKTDINQSTVEILGVGTERSNPDFYALSVMNEIFSGGVFGNRLVQYVRTKLGLAYDVGGSFGAGYDHPGVFRTVVGTKSATTDAATKAALEEIGRLKTVPPTPEEMRRAKDEVMNSFIFNYDTPEKILNEQVLLAFYGYPSDYLEKYKDAVERVTAADVNRVANKYIDVSKLAILVVGNRAQIEPPLSDLGKVTTLDIAIPPPPGGPAAAAPGNQPPGQ